MSGTIKRLVVAGGGFAGVWACAAASALRHRVAGTERVEITLFSRDAQLLLRPRLYEELPDVIAQPLAPIMDVLDVGLDVSEISSIDLSNRHALVADGGQRPFDAIVLAMGSQLARPHIPGLREFAHDVDSIASAASFWETLRHARAGATVAVIGAGLTGLELVTEVAAKQRFETLLIDSRPDFSHLFAPEAARVVEAALAGTRTRLGCRVSAIEPRGVVLTTGEILAADVVAWTAGMRAHPLTEQLGCATDELGRLVTDPYLRLKAGIYAAGDMAQVRTDGQRAPMSCQFAIPTGITAGHNAMAELLGEPVREFLHQRYVTCMDLGAAGGLLTQGWEREPISTGSEAKAIKKDIMRMICPPTDRDALYSMVNRA